MSSSKKQTYLGASDKPNETTADRTALPSVGGDYPDR